MADNFMWTEAAFSVCLAWHWPDHHWQCNWRVVWTSSRMCAGKRQTLWAPVVTIFSHMTRGVSVFVKCDTIFRLFYWKLLQFHTSNFCKVVQQHTESMMRRDITTVNRGQLVFMDLSLVFAMTSWPWLCAGPPTKSTVWFNYPVKIRCVKWVLLEIYLALQQWKNSENPLRIDKVITMSFVYYFFGTQCIKNCCGQCLCCMAL